MQSSKKRHLFAGVGAAALLLLFLGEPTASERRIATLALTDSERMAVTSPVRFIEKISNGKGELEEQLRLLLDELKQFEKEAEEKFQKDILPYIKREIEKLRNRLKEFYPDKKETPLPQRTRA
jgi:hypothetical protein